MSILFYYPDKERAVSLSSLMVAFSKQGHRVLLLTHALEGDLHEAVKKHGILTFTCNFKKKNSFTFYLKHIFFLASFTKKQKIDIVYSHIQCSNFISAFAQFLSPSRFIFCRHHSDCAYVDNNFMERLFDRIINWLGNEFIVPSQKVFDQVRFVEGARNKKIHLIRYAYDFSEYPLPDIMIVQDIRNRYQCRLLMIKVARLIPEKRHLILFETIKNLVREGYDVKLLVLSVGKEWDNLDDFIRKNQLQNHIFMLGYQNNIMNFVAASDVVVHVSESEASNNFIKEVSLVKKPVIVCSGVGDFDEYVKHMVNGIILPKNVVVADLEEVLKRIYSGKLNLLSLGQNLYRDVIALFSIENVISDYSVFHFKKNC